MREYYVIRDKNTGLYFRGKGVNRWGKYFNQASIYRVKGMAEHSIKGIAWHGEQAEIVPIQIIESTAEVEEVRHGEWVQDKHWQYDYTCSICCEYACEGNYGNHDNLTDFCPNCGAKMDGGKTE